MNRTIVIAFSTGPRQPGRTDDFSAAMNRIRLRQVSAETVGPAVLVRYERELL